MDTEESELIDQIHAAFCGVRLEDGVSLNQTAFFDSGGLRPEFEQIAMGDERDNWAAIPDETLEQFAETFCFTDLKGYRFYLPAYMSWWIRNHRKSDALILETTVSAIDPTRYQFDEIPFLDWFTEDQIEAMKRFLDFAASADESARENLEKIASAPQNAGTWQSPNPESPLP
jgi:hypothetical protein